MQRANEIFDWDGAKITAAWLYVTTGALPANARRRPVGRWPQQAIVPIPGCPGCLALAPEMMQIGQSGISLNQKNYPTFSKAPFVKNQNRVVQLHVLACLADPNWTGGAPDRATAEERAASSAFDFSHVCLCNCCLNPQHIILEPTATNVARGNSCCSRLSVADSLVVAQNVNGLTLEQQQAVSQAYADKVLCQHGPPSCISTRESLLARDAWYPQYNV
jgi:hypothetical protein